MATQQEAYYPLPRAGETSAETKRLNDQHEMFKLLMGSIQSAPLSDKVSDVLDLGCGTGIWCYQFAELYPSASILGVDISPPATIDSDSPPPKNCKFQQANIEDSWHFAQPLSLDYIFARLLVVAIRDWRQLFERAYNSLRPGGMLELVEGCMIFSAEDGGEAKDSAMAQWWGLLREHNAARNLDIKAPMIFTKLLQDCGFKVIHDQPVKLYMDSEVALRHGIPNGGQVAAQSSADCRGMVMNVTEKVFNTDSHRALAAEALKDLDENSRQRGYYMLCVNKVAQKPLH